MGNKKFKKLRWFIGIVIFLYCLPTLLTELALFYYGDWQKNAEISAEQIAQGQPYCIVWEPANFSGVSASSFEQLDIELVVSEAVKYRLFPRREPFRKMHFGILVDEKLYLWSFSEQRFSDRIAYFRDYGQYFRRREPYLVRLRELLISGEDKRALGKATKYQITSGDYSWFTLRQALDDIRFYHSVIKDFTLDNLVCPHI